MLKFFNNPRGAKLIAKPERSDTSEEFLFYGYNYIPKGKKDENGKWEKNSWNFIKRDKSIKRKKERKWKKCGALQDWEAVNMFMKEWEEQLKEDEQKTI